MYISGIQLLAALPATAAKKHIDGADLVATGRIRRVYKIEYR